MRRAALQRPPTHLMRSWGVLPPQLLVLCSITGLSPVGLAPAADDDLGRELIMALAGADGWGSLVNWSLAKL